MTPSQQLIEGIFNPEHASERPEQLTQWEADHAIYRRVAEKLNGALPTERDRLAMLLVHAQFLFKNRNRVFPVSRAGAYARSLQRDLPRRAPRYLPDLESFLRLTGIDCPADRFDHAVILRMDVLTGVIGALRDPLYLELRNHFLEWRNCETPLDLLMWGLFRRRAEQNTGRLIKGFLLVVVLALFLVFRPW